MTNPIDLFVESVNSFDSDEGFLIEQMLGTLTETFHQLISEGRGIKRFLCFVLGIIPYMILLTTLLIIAILYGIIMWLILPKDEFREWADKNNF